MGQANAVMNYYQKRNGSPSRPSTPEQSRVAFPEPISSKKKK
jgi:hypothetical protein